MLNLIVWKIWRKCFDFFEEDEDDVLFSLPKLPVPDKDEDSLTLTTTTRDYVRLADFAANVFLNTNAGHQRLDLFVNKIVNKCK